VRPLLLTLLAITIALLSASVLPWLPLLRWVPTVTLAVVVFLVARVRLAHLLAVTAGTLFLADVFGGFPVGVRAAMLLSGMLLLWPVIRTYVLHRQTTTLLAIAVVLASLEALATAIAAGGFPPTRWAALLPALWPAAAWGAAVAVVLHRFAR
jgi:hypothetical protein